ncbi:type II secretion system minor pseudopilin GspH [Hahella ganghwensis]|uniref:type II secretion system minor pseudopilin GspH n=1 Tax=Hahella ganghwensis TaxID=286420 RepID=UPI00036F035E|nr:type II secretion system minor pseudopilin GspH [Hahella ganghwensis]
MDKGNFSVSQRGFTLIEILVVMLIIGMVVSMATLVVSGNKEHRMLENESRKLLAILQLTQEEAVFQNIEIGVRIDDEGYEFRSLNEEELKWEELPQDFLKTRTFPEWLELDYGDLTKEYKLKQDKQSSKPAFMPQIMFLSSGESTPFKLTLKFQQGDDFQYSLESDGLNGITLVEPQDDE